jgi:hypothetical protein
MTGKKLCASVRERELYRRARSRELKIIIFMLKISRWKLERHLFFWFPRLRCKHFTIKTLSLTSVFIKEDFLWCGVKSVMKIMRFAMWVLEMAFFRIRFNCSIRHTLMSQERLWEEWIWIWSITDFILTFWCDLKLRLIILREWERELLIWLTSLSHR